MLRAGFSLKFVVPRVISMGTRQAFESWSLLAAVCYVAMGQACRPASATPLRKAAQYIIPAMLVSHSWTEPSTFAIRNMVIKQGTVVTSAGKGELSAAYECFNVRPSQLISAPARSQRV